MVLVAGGCGLVPWADRSYVPDVRDPKAATNRASEGRPAVHVVRRGETLSAIAWQHGLDYRSIALWNRIHEPYVIYPGQKLALHGAAATSTPAKGKNARAGSGAKRPAGAAPAAASASAPAPAGNWTWPARGPLIRGFGKGDRGGIDIAGQRGQSVVAARGGRVVYTGSGLVGYGRLVIIKHSERLLTAYAHNDRVVVKEGQTVRAGEKIAEMGSTGAERVKLHFEVRRDGKPLNPLTYLPRRS